MSNYYRLQAGYHSLFERAATRLLKNSTLTNSNSFDVAETGIMMNLADNNYLKAIASRIGFREVRPSIKDWLIRDLEESRSVVKGSLCAVSQAQQLLRHEAAKNA